MTTHIAAVVAGKGEGGRGGRYPHHLNFQNHGQVNHELFEFEKRG